MEAKWGENGGWYIDNVAVPTEVGHQISGLRRDEKRIAITGHRDPVRTGSRDIGKRTVDAAKWWIGTIARKYPNAVIITGGALGTDMSRFSVPILGIPQGGRSRARTSTGSRESGHIQD